MTSLNTQLPALLQDCYHEYKELLSERLSNHDSLSWFLEENTGIFKPDYFTVHTVGNTLFKQQANSFVHRYHLPSWKWLVWDKVVHNSTLFLKHQIINRFKHQLDESDYTRFSTQSLPLINDFFKHPPKQDISLLSQSTFTELFSFFSKLTIGLCDLFSIPHDLYLSDKRSQNDGFHAIYSSIKEEVLGLKKPLIPLLYLATRGNWMDATYEKLAQFELGFKEEINLLLNQADEFNAEIKENAYFQIKGLRALLDTKPLSILYEMDNAGEFFMDVLFIDYLLSQGHTVHIMTKKAPILNDMTLGDIQQLLEDGKLSHWYPYTDSKQLSISHTGSVSVGKNPFMSSEIYKSSYQAADLLILKGQGNLQTMPMGQRDKKGFTPYRYRCPILYLSGIKAPMIQEGLASVFSKGFAPHLESTFAYFFDPKEPKTYPK